MIFNPLSLFVIFLFLNNLSNLNIDSRNSLIKSRRIEFITKGRNRLFSYSPSIGNSIQFYSSFDLESLVTHLKTNDKKNRHNYNIMF